MPSAPFSYRNITVTDAPSAHSQKGPKKVKKVKKKEPKPLSARNPGSETVRNRTKLGPIINDECRTRQPHSSSPVEVTQGAPRNKFRNKHMFMQFVVGPTSSPCHTVTTVMTTERESRRARRWNPHAIRSVELIYSVQNIHDEPNGKCDDITCLKYDTPNERQNRGWGGGPAT